MRVTFITTLNHNVGDDFVREGILYLLERTLGSFDAQHIHKHIPLTARPEWDWYYHRGWSRMLSRVPRIGAGLRISQAVDRLPLNLSTDKILTCDVLVQSGAPIYWWHPPKSTCATAEWNEPLLQRRWHLIKDRATLLNLAGGTCQRYHSTGEEFAESPATLNYIKSFFDICKLTTVRDTLSCTVLKHVDREAVALPCTSIFARQRLGYKKDGDKYVALNYMPGAGHYAFGQSIDPLAWQNTFVSFSSRLAKRTKCVLICHNKKELNAAKELMPQIELFYSEDHREILQFYSQARFGIVNRVHAAFAIASYGRPSIVVGTDTRAKMTEMIGLESLFVSDATSEVLACAVEELESKVSTYERSFTELAQTAESDYITLLKSALNV